MTKPSIELITVFPFWPALCRCWNIRSGACMKVFNGHCGTITCLDFHEEQFVSGARDGMVKGESQDRQLPGQRQAVVSDGQRAWEMCDELDGEF